MKTPAPDDLTGKFYQRFKGRHNINSTIIFQKIENNTFQLFFTQGQPYPDTKTRKRQYKKRKL